jgi:hypothetical protein
MSDVAHPFITHVERCLGPIQAGATLREGVQGARFGDCPHKGASAFMTLGLSHHAFTQSRSPRVRIEFLVACRDQFVESFRPLSVLADVSDQAVLLHSAPARGTVIGPRGRFFEKSEMQALYCTHPTYFDDALSCFDGFPEPLVVVWLVPITPDEATYVQLHGWSAFEDRLEKDQPDLLDLERSPIITGGA